MKKLYTALLAAAMLLSLASCADPTIEQPDINVGAPATELGQITEQPAEPQEPMEEVATHYEFVKPVVFRTPTGSQNPQEVDGGDETDIINITPRMPCFNSLDDFHVAIMEKSFVGLAVDANATTQYATSIYEPVPEDEKYVFHHVICYDAFFDYYIVPVEFADYPNFLIDNTDNAVLVRVFTQPNEISMDDLKEIYKVDSNDEGYFFARHRETVDLGYLHNGHRVEIVAPHTFGGYDFLRSLCSVEKVTLVAGVGVVDNDVVDNNLVSK